MRPETPSLKAQDGRKSCLAEASYHTFPAVSIQVRCRNLAEQTKSFILAARMRLRGRPI